MAMAAGYDFDLFTLGAGSGGVAASRRAAAYGARVGICEGSRVGGTCVIRGCVPKKLLVYAGQFRDAFDDAAGFGWTVAEPGFDWATLIAHKDREIDRLNLIYRGMLEKAGVTLFPHWGRLVDAHTVDLGERRVTAERILIATGGRPARPAIPGIEHALISDDLFELKQLPQRVVILGGGYIALEFAGIFRALGAEVTLVMRGPTILTGFDDECRRFLADELVKRGIRLETGARPARLERHPGGVTVVTEDGRQLEGEVVVAALGRTPNTRGLGLEAAGVALDPQGAVVVGPDHQTSVPGLYAVGDVTNRVALTPVAIAEGRALVETLYNNNPITVDYRNIPSAVFTSPPLATVGLSEEAARAQELVIDVYRTDFRPMKHTLSGRNERTLVKLVVERASDRVVGAHMVGADAPEIIQGLAVALNCGATKRQFDRTIGLHPSSAEEFVILREPRPESAGLSPGGARS